jgi:hypothetical protein
MLYLLILQRQLITDFYFEGEFVSFWLHVSANQSSHHQADCIDNILCKITISVVVQTFAYGIPLRNKLYVKNMYVYTLYTVKTMFWYNGENYTLKLCKL